MPTISVVDHPATSWTQRKLENSEQLLEAACPRQYRRCQRIVQSSFTRSELRTGHISASDNGFVWAAYYAYSHHHHLVIRPDDVWFAILTQLSFFINANAEELRSYFVAHEGQKELHAISDISDFGALAIQMTALIAKNVIDPDLKDWVMPSFTTTTTTDKVVGAVLFMGAMQKYFSYSVSITCGLPSVTLLGEVDDWKEILKRLDKINLLGEEPRQFATMLRPVLQHIILSCEDPTNTEVTRFWNTIVHRNVMGSGTDYLSGWLTAFCFWNAEGEAKQPSQINAQFDGVAFPIVGVDDIPAGFASVPVAVNDNGDEYSATMVAGSVGIAASHQNTALGRMSVSSVLEEPPTPDGEPLGDGSSDEPIRDTIQPVSGWWIYEDEASEAVAAREAEMKRIRDEMNKQGEDIGNIFGNPERLREYFALSSRLNELEAY